MDTRQLEYMIAIAENKSISKAAESLYISQSGLNQQLIKLEKELGTQLFYRSTHYLSPTAAGKIYINNARLMLQLKKTTYTQIGDLVDSNTGEINLGLTAEHGIDLFTDVWPAFRDKYPGVTLNLYEGIVRNQNKMLLSGHLDMGFVMVRKCDRIKLHYIPLFHERLVLGVPRQHPLAREYGAKPGEPLSTIDLALFSEEEFSLIFAGSTQRAALRPAFEAAGFEPHILFETSMNHVLSTMVGRNLCCTIIPQSRARNFDKVAWFYLTSDPSWDVCLVYNENNPPSKASSYFIQLARNWGEEMGQKLSEM